MGISYNQANLYNYSRLGTRMNIKKIITTVAFVLCAWMSIGAAQATNYNFTFTGEPDGEYSGVITGVFGVTGDNGSGYFITSISG